MFESFAQSGKALDPQRIVGCAALAFVVLSIAFGGLVIAGDPRIESRTPVTVEAIDATNRRCLRCHGQAHIASLTPAERRTMVGTLLESDVMSPAPVPPPAPVQSPSVGPEPEPEIRPELLVHFNGGPHAVVTCVECHRDAAQLPHEPALAAVNCTTTCHEAVGETFRGGAHGAAAARGDALAPSCVSCHGGHDVLSIAERASAQHRLNSLYSCANCHKHHEPAAEGISDADRIDAYIDSTHARALMKSGLPLSATCSDCHTAHGVRPASDPASSVHRANVPATCGKCHVGIVEKYEHSVHAGPRDDGTGARAVCTDCHASHRITLASSPQFMLDVVKECGRCHDSPDARGERVGTSYQTYANSYHGQVTNLGTTRAARCSDCHGAHDILPGDDPASRVAPGNLVQTCSRCHPGATASFVRFDPHANHRDAVNYPVLHAVWLYFMAMMSTVFTCFGVHTILWFIRARRDRAASKPHAAHAGGPTAGGRPASIRRFSALDRINHALVAITFFGLTATGIPLVFSADRWARVLADVFGGVEAAGLWHRFFAILLIVNFALHFAGLALAFRRRTCSAREWLFGPNSLLPRWKDAKDIVGMCRWFFGLGRPPRLDRWTYWEKFDYWAEVGGSMIIGGSGLLLWMPELAARIFPGWIFNIAMIVHGYEALLAIGFIFTIHFFNAHLRPGTFPVDPVIFTGTLPEEELKTQRPEEYERLVTSGRIAGLRASPPDPRLRPLIVGVAVISVGFGLLLLVLILIGGFL